MKDYVEYVKCNLCGADDFHIVYKGDPIISKEDYVERYRSSGDELTKDRIVKCKKCGLIYVNPRLRSDIILDGYSEGSDELFVSQAKGREITFKKCMKLINRHAKIEKNQIQKNNLHIKKGKIFDIGTAGGSFLHVAKKDGWEVYGVEPNKWLCGWAEKNYGLKIKTGTLFDTKYQDNFFDVITLWDVLEHTSDPAAVLKECNRILKKGGLLVINYPDIGSIVSKVMKKKWVFLLTVHLYYFTKQTIRDILKINGFKVVKIKPHFQGLSLGYLVFRTKAYSKLAHKIGSAVVKTFRLHNIQVPYWLGQTLVLARK